MRSGRKPRPAFAHVLVAVLGLSIAAHAGARDLYVNRCAGGCTVFSGPENALTQTSSIVPGTRGITAFAHGDGTFDATVACIRRAFAPFAVSVVTIKPTVAHHQLILAGSASEAGFQSVLGIAPYSPGVVTENAIAFAFASDIGSDAATLCWRGAQQVAALYGLDLEFSCPDLTSNLTTCPIADKAFTDFDAPCGGLSPRACQDGPNVTTQNSYQLLAIRAGLNQLFADSFETGTATRQAPD